MLRLSSSVPRNRFCCFCATLSITAIRPLIRTRRKVETLDPVEVLEVSPIEQHITRAVHIGDPIHREAHRLVKPDPQIQQNKRSDE